MNGRVYDPIVGRFLSPDNHIQAPGYSQSFNRYAYAFNNPFKYTDPSGDIIALTDIGYEFWKYNSPIAIKIDIHTGKEQRGLGINVSVGVPKALPLSYRKHWGATYYTNYYDDGFTGWELRSGNEFSIYGIITLSNTKFKVPGSYDWDQTTTRITLGGPALNFQYENDHMFHLPLTKADDGDRWRTAAFRLNTGPVSYGQNLVTGDPGFLMAERESKLIKGRYTYVNSGVYDTEFQPDKYRAGIAYFKFGFIKMGINSEKVRHLSQNLFAHDMLTGKFGFDTPSAKWFRIDETRSNEFYFYFGTETGGTLW